MNNKKLIAAHLIGLLAVGFSETTIAAHRPLMPLAVTFLQEPCVIPSNPTKYAPIHQLQRVIIQYPKAALDARIAGYAGAEFQLDATGAPRDIKLVCEKPTGYGIGQALVDALKQEKFKPSPPPDQWYYDSVSLGVDMVGAKH